jgi:hypothetical protein
MCALENCQWCGESCFAGVAISIDGLVEVEVTLLTVSQSVSQYVLVSSTLVGLATRYYFQSEYCCLKFAVLFLWGVLSNERTGLQFQCNHSMLRVTQNPQPYFTVSSETPPTWRARFPYLNPPGT